MKFHDIKPTTLLKSKKRIARGISGHGGRTAGRGSKGQKARTGHNIPRGFEGGQTKLAMRLPKVGGFKSLKISNYIIKSSIINKNFKDSEIVNPKTLKEKNLTNNLKSKQKIKILFDEKLSAKVIFKDVLTSKKVIS